MPSMCAGSQTDVVEHAGDRQRQGDRARRAADRHRFAVAARRARAPPAADSRTTSGFAVPQVRLAVQRAAAVQVHPPA